MWIVLLQGEQPEAYEFRAEAVARKAANEWNAAHSSDDAIALEILPANELKNAI